MTEIKITPETKLEDLSQQLDKLKSTENATFVDSGDDGVRIVFAKENSNVDPNKVHWQGSGGSTSVAEFAEMKAKSMLYEQLVERSSEENAALVFSVKSDLLFDEDHAFSKDPAGTVRELIERSNVVQKTYLKKGRFSFGDKKRKSRLDNLHQILANRDTNSKIDPSETAVKKGIPIKDGSKIHWPEPNVRQRIQSDTPSDGPADPTSWLAQFSISTVNDQLISHQFDLVEEYQTIVDEMKSHTQADKIAKITETNIANILKSSSERNKIEKAIYKNILHKLGGKADRTDEQKHQNSLDARKEMRRALIDAVTISETQTGWAGEQETEPEN